MNQDPIVVVGMARTPIGSYLGALSSLSAAELGACAIRAAVERSGVPVDAIDEVIMGCVLPAALGQAPARQAALAAGLPQGVPTTTLNKVCGSSMKTVMVACDALRAESADIVVAGGMESMSNAPFMLPGARKGLKFGHQQFLDHMLMDGLQDAYSGKAMGEFAELCAGHYDFSREQQDEYALASLERATTATANGYFAGEIVPVTVKSRKGEQFVDQDEQPGKANPDKIPQLRPAFLADGTVTAANASSISDGAAALVLMRRSTAEERGLKSLATIEGYGQSAQAPEWFTTAPVAAMKKVLNRVGWQTSEVDLFEVNEAFAVVAMAAMRELGIDHGVLNVNGGACALGHPLGTSGARILVTLINAMQRLDHHKGLASLCIGGGEATAVAVSRS